MQSLIKVEQKKIVYLSIRYLHISQLYIAGFLLTTDASRNVSMYMYSNYEGKDLY